MVVKHSHHFLQLLFAIFISYLLITRLFITWVQYAPEQFVESVEWVSNSQISVEGIEIQQDWLGFQFQVNRLEATHVDYDLRIQHLDMDVNLFSMLIPKMALGDYLTLKGGAYFYKKPQASEKTTFKNVFELEEWTQIKLDISPLWRRVKVSDMLLNALIAPDVAVHIYDYQSLKGAKLSVVSEFGVSYKESLNFERFGVKAIFETNLLGRIEQGSFNLHSFQPLRMEAVAQQLPAIWHDVLPKGELILDLNARVLQSKLAKLTLNLHGQSLKWSQAHPTLPKHIGLELLWAPQNQNRHVKDWQFKLSNIQLDNQYLQAVSPIEIRLKENQELTFSAEQFDLEPFKVIVKSLVTNKMVAALFNQTSGLGIQGLNGTFNWQTFALPKLDMTIQNLKIPVTEYPGIELRDLTIVKRQDNAVLKTDKVITLSGLGLDKGGVKIKLPKEVRLKRLLTNKKENNWVLEPLNFKVDNMPVTLKATGNRQGVVDASLMIHVGSMNTLKQYMPYQFLDIDLQNWLKMALVDGQNIKANIVLKGDLNQFPFKEGGGVFKITANAENAFIKFDPDWPMLEDFKGQVEFTPYQLKITSPSIHVGANAYAKEVEVLIPNLDKDNVALVFKGRVQTKLNYAASYLTLSPLASLLSIEDFIENAQFKGGVDVTLERVWIPLAGYNGKEEMVLGHIVFKQSEMTLFDNIPFKKIKGRLDFSEKGVKAKNLSASVFGHKSNFTVDTQPKNKQIVIQGKGAFLEQKNPFFDNVLPWDLDIYIPFENETAESVDIQLGVNLAKATSLLPEPFDAQALDGKNLNIQIKLAKERLSFAANVPNLLEAKGHWSIQNNLYQAQQFSVLLGAESLSDLDKQGIKSYVIGHVEGVNLDAWVDYANYLPTELLSGEASSTLDWKPSVIEIKSLKFRENSYPNVRFEWLKRNLKTVLQIKSADILANMVMKPDMPIEMSVERLRLHSIESTADSETALESENELCQFNNAQENNNQKNNRQAKQYSESLLPEIAFKGKNIEVSGYKIDSLQFHLLDVNERLTITDMVGSFGQKNGVLTGQYLFDKKSDNSSLSLTLTSKEVAELLRFMKLKQGFTGRKANVDLNLSWQGALECFTVKKAIGLLKFKLEEGAIEDIEPGFARLIGLLSIESLARRLQLNLKDVTHKGMVYDQIKGKAQLKSGILELDSFKLTAPSASVALFGQVDLLKESFALKADVTPAIGSTIPTIAALAGYANPLAALAVYAVMKVIPGVNENLVTFRYNVTGPWSDPKVSDIEEEKKEYVPLFEPEPSILDTQQ